MAFLHNISTVARYEAKTLSRSWFFRLFSIGALVILTFMNIGLFSPIGGQPWEIIAISSSMPLINLYLLNIGQAIVVIFLAADFLKRDKKLDTNEVLYTRSISNLEYVAGKTLGILRLFITLDVLILLICLVFNIISKKISIDLLSYFEYLLIIPVPTIIFSLGLAFMLMSLIRNQALTFLLLLGYAALDMFYLNFRAGFLFDYMVFGLPVFKSGLIGFDNPSQLINQRLIYLSLGLSMVLITVLVFKRLPQSRIQRTLSVILLVFCLSGFGESAYKTWSGYRKDALKKEHAIETNRLFELQDFPSIVRMDLDVVHKDHLIKVTSDITILNDNDTILSHYLFSLNPSLDISGIIADGKELIFKRTGHVVEIDPGKYLLPGETDSLTIEYSGTIDESFCYPDFTDNIKHNPYRIAMLNVGKRQSFLTKDYVLLTPETHWYPVAGLNYYPSNPARIKIDFINFTLKARSENDLVVISQGPSQENDGWYLYKPVTPLTGLTLVMGNYLSDRMEIDSVEYVAWYYKGDDYYKEDLAEIKDTLTYLVSGIMRELETNFSAKYPFKTFSIVEAPVQYYSFPKKSTQTRAEVQPSLVIVPEKLVTVQQAGFARQINRQKRQMARNNQVITDKELQVRVFNNFLRNTFISGENYRYVNGVSYNEPVRYLMGPSFYFFRNNFYSETYPVINAAFESHLQRINNLEGPPSFRSMFGDLSDNDKANIILKGTSFRKLLEENPGGDTMRLVLTVKGDYFFNLLRSKAGIREFNEWFKQYMDKNSFKRINILKLDKDINEKFGFSFYPSLDNWFNGTRQPGFLFSGLTVNEVVVDNRSRFQVTFNASNPEPVEGLFNISFRLGGQEGGGERMVTFNQRGYDISVSAQGRGMESSDIDRIVYLGPAQAKKIGIILDGQPRAMLINTIFAQNLPGEITVPAEKITKSKYSTGIFEGEEILPSIPPYSDPGEIIVDNEDPGFINIIYNETNRLKKILGIKKRRGETYGTMNMYFAPEFWQKIIQTSYYGKYIRSSVYTRSGSDNRSVTWKGIITSPGYYDIYTYIGKTGDQISSQGERRNDDRIRDLHFSVFHDEGVEEITVDYPNAEPGWNLLGSYYLSPDTVKVSLTNQSSGRAVIGDAVKWVLQK